MAHEFADIAAENFPMTLPECLNRVGVDIYWTLYIFFEVEILRTISHVAQFTSADTNPTAKKIEEFLEIIFTKPLTERLVRMNLWTVDFIRIMGLINFLQAIIYYDDYILGSLCLAPGINRTLLDPHPELERPHPDDNDQDLKHISLYFDKNCAMLYEEVSSGTFLCCF